MSNSYKRTNWIKSSCSTSQKMRSIVSVKDTDIISTFILDHIKYKHRKILAFMLKWEKNNVYIYIFSISGVRWCFILRISFLLFIKFLFSHFILVLQSHQIHDWVLTTCLEGSLELWFMQLTPGRSDYIIIKHILCFFNLRYISQI